MAVSQEALIKPTYEASSFFFSMLGDFQKRYRSQWVIMEAQSISVSSS